MTLQINMTLFQKFTDQEDGTPMSQNNQMVEVWMPGSFIEHRVGGGEEIK